MQFETSLPAEISAISRAVDSVLQLVRRSGRASGKEFEIEMAVREALANAILHGCHGDPTKSVECGVDFNDAGGILIVVRDPGAGFDPTRLPDPTLKDNVHSEHGRGVFLIHRLMDEVTYERGGTEIHMRKY
ncbi:MAG: ATP-binding protein [Candidatus Acidiferrales bacterium]